MKRSTWLYVGGAVAAVVAFVWWRSRSQASAAATAPYTSTPVYGYNPAGYNPQDSSSDTSGLTPSGSSSNYTDPASAGVGASTGSGPTYVGGQSLNQSQFYPGTVPGTTSNTFGAAGTPIGPGLGGGTLVIGAPSGAWSPGGQPLHLYSGAVR